MPSSYNKYLEYLGHVDDTTREDMLAREAKIREEVEAQKKRNQEELRLAKEQCERRVAEARAAIEEEKKKSARALAEKEASLISTITSLRADIDAEKVRGKKLLSERETALKRELAEQKKLYEKFEADIRSHYESRIAELEQASKPWAFLSKVKGCKSQLLGEIHDSKNWTISKNDFEENKYGAFGYLFSLIGMALSLLPWIQVFSLLFIPAGFVASIVGVNRGPKTKARQGITISFVGIVIFLCTYILYGELFRWYW